MRSSGVARTGVFLMGASVVLWIALLGVPFLPLETEARIGVAGALIVGAEIVFWLGAALAGPEAVRRFKQWRRSKLRLPFRRGDTPDMRAEDSAQNGSDSSVSPDSANVHGRRLSSRGNGLRDLPDSTGVRRNPPTSTP